MSLSRFLAFCARIRGSRTKPDRAAPGRAIRSVATRVLGAPPPSLVAGSGSASSRRRARAPRSTPARSGVRPATGSRVAATASRRVRSSPCRHPARRDDVTPGRHSCSAYDCATKATRRVLLGSGISRRRAAPTHPNRRRSVDGRCSRAMRAPMCTLGLVVTFAQ